MPTPILSTNTPPVMPTITPWHWESLHAPLSIYGLNIVSAASAAWPAASVAIFAPFLLPRRISVDAMFANNGTSASDNIDLGVYTIDGRRLASLGPTGRTGTGVLQAFSMTTFSLGPGRFYMAICLNGTTGSFVARAPTVSLGRAMGLMQQDLSGESVPGTLPAVATFATMAQAYLPVFGLRRAGFTS